MNLLSFYAWVIALLLFSASCSKENDLVAIDYFIFGSYYGFCVGNCTTIYKFSGNQLYSDNINHLLQGESIEFLDEPIADEHRVQLAKHILDDFNSNLQFRKDTIIGCPDCADQGGYYFEIKSKASGRKWYVDTNTSNLEDGLRQFIERFRENLVEIAE